MNKAVTEGLQFMPPAFSEGLRDWSQGNGTPPTAEWHNASNAAIVPSDGDFGRCLEVMKTETLTRVRYKGETPIVPGCYLRVSVRIKAISGNLPTAQIGAWAGEGGGEHASNLIEDGPATTLTSYGQVVEISAIVGTGARGGVDMPWGLNAIYGHFGLDLTGPTGGVVRIENVRIEDVTHIFQRDMMDWVDVRDFGAVGDGNTDDSAAFEAADAAANGRRVLVSPGTYQLDDHVTFSSEVRFSGQVQMPADKRLHVLRNFNLDTYYDAFGDEMTGFKKAVQAFFNHTDHDALDLCGRVIQVESPIDLHAVVGNQDESTIRKVIRNGQFNAEDSTDWDPDVVPSQATYDTSKPLELKHVANISQIAVGSLVAGDGVGREVYVLDKNNATGKLTLSHPLYDAAGTQTFTFTRFKYMLDFSGFSRMAKFIFHEVDFRCNSRASGIMLAHDGDIFHLRDCDFTKPKDRGITSVGVGCQGMLIDRCNFISSELGLPVAQRTAIGFNVNANDVKLRNSRAVRFKHFVVMNGAGHIVTGNHWFQGDGDGSAQRTAGLIFTQLNLKSTVYGNYIDNSYIEWTNEYDESPDYGVELSFGGLTIADNIFTLNNGNSLFSFIVIKPHGSGHFIHGLSVTNNVFKSLDVRLERVEKVDDSIAPLDSGRMRNVTFDGNIFNDVDKFSINPVTIDFDRNSPEKNWVLEFGDYLPFDGNLRQITAAVVDGILRDSSNDQVFPGFSFNANHGPNKTQARMNFPYPVEGRVYVTGRMDNPI